MLGKNKGSEKKLNKLPKRSLTSRFDSLNKFRHWYMGGVSLTRSMFRVRAAWQTIVVILAIFGVMFTVASFFTESGEFVISLDSDMSNEGFCLSNTAQFEEKLVSLSGSAVIEANNISVFDINRNVDSIDGEHNGNNYVAYTFYIKNECKEVKDYRYSLEIRNADKNAEKAVWIMVFINGKQTVYAMRGSDGNPEAQYSISKFPFMDVAADVDSQYAEVDEEEFDIKDIENTVFSTGKVNKLIATPFENERVICNGERKEIDVNESDKYTVVIWYEGEDPECTDDILGGWVELFMKFDY